MWNCDQCRQPFHLGCIKRWIKKLNTNADEEEKEEVKRPQAYDDYGDEETEARKAAKKIVAFFSWTCPNCNYSSAENSMPRYLCYCGRLDEPPFSPLQLPHSCGEYCDKKKSEHCTHSKCEIMCHPGSCPPCGITVGVKCYCQKESKRVPCSVSTKSQYSCTGVCGKLLNCKVHTCEKECHAGPCDKCDVDVQLKCFCEK